MLTLLGFPAGKSNSCKNHIYNFHVLESQNLDFEFLGGKLRGGAKEKLHFARGCRKTKYAAGQGWKERANAGTYRCLDAAVGLDNREHPRVGLAKVTATATAASPFARLSVRPSDPPPTQPSSLPFARPPAHPPTRPSACPSAYPSIHPPACPSACPRATFAHLSALPWPMGPYLAFATPGKPPPPAR